MLSWRATLPSVSLVPPFFVIALSAGCTTGPVDTNSPTRAEPAPKSTPPPPQQRSLKAIVNASPPLVATPMTTAPSPPPPPSAAALRYELQKLCWAVRTECMVDDRGMPFYKVTARFESPFNQLHSEVVRVESSDYTTVLRRALADVRGTLRLGIFRGGPETPAREEQLRRELESRCWSYRIDYHRMNTTSSYEILVRAHDDHELSGTQSMVVTAGSFSDAASQVLNQLGG